VSAEANQVAQPESKADPKSVEISTKWLKAIEERRHLERKWRTETAPAVINRYRDERAIGQNEFSRLNIFWANVETLKAAIFARMPVPDVRRRFTTADPAARTAALMLERCLMYSSDVNDLHDTLDRCNEDYLIPGRAMCVVRYIPTIEQQQNRVPVEPLPNAEDDDPKDSTREELQEQFSDAPPEPQYPEGTQFDEQGAYQMQTKEELVYQEVSPEYVAWDLFVFGQCRTWKKCPWIAIGALLTKDEVRKRYPHCADELDYRYSERMDKDGEKEQGHYALLWDVWHRPSRKFIVVSEKYEGCVYEQDDPLGLEGFFPVPEPMYSVRNNRSWDPKPEFALYQDQANELDIVTDRLKGLTEMCKVRGGYDSAVDNEQFKFSDIMRKPDGTLVPISNWRGLMEKGGLSGVVDFLPLEQIVATIQQLRERQAELKQEIYEITGISDIVRGSTQASETLGAQQLKAQYAGLRISTRQQRFQRFTREVFQIMGEIIAEHFDPQTLKLMSGINVLPDLAYDQMKQQKKLPVGAISESEFNSAIQILQNDKLRGFKVDIETDSTIPADKQSEQQGRMEFLQAMASYLQQAMPAVQAGLIPAPIAREGLLFGVRAFKVGSEFEEVLEQLGDDEQPTQQQVQQLQQQNQQLQQENQQLQQGQQVDMAKVQGDQQIAQYKAQSDVSLDQWKAQQEMALKQMEHTHQTRLDSMTLMLKAMMQKMGIEQQQQQSQGTLQ
jgi:hypothetical protein